MPNRPADPTATDPVAAARVAGLRYVSDASPGIVRRRRGRGFVYVDPRGRVVRDREMLDRIRRLAIPPAWRDVWICPLEHGHIQAVGRDARGRKQYRYHPRWRAVRDETKYGRLVAFAHALPKIRAQVEADLARPGLPRDKVLATVVRLLETTLIRVGNEAYARTNGSFGLATLRTRHVDVDGATVRFHFRGKAGKQHTVGVRDPRLARVVRRCQELPGQELFQYADDTGELRSIGSDGVNEYLRQGSGEDFTTKDFRTWAGTVLAALALAAIGPSPTATAIRRNTTRAVAAVATLLGNTPAVCRAGYVHPAVLEAYADRVVLDPAGTPAIAGLRPEEAAVAAFLAERLAAETARAAA